MNIKNIFIRFSQYIKGQFFRYRVFLKHLMLSSIVLVALFCGWNLYNDYIYVKKNHFIQVPDFTGIHIRDLDSVSDHYNLRYEIRDSIFDKSKRKGVVVKQYPLPNIYVRDVRKKIDLTVTALQARIVYFPDIHDEPQDVAQNTLKNVGLKVGKLQYELSQRHQQVLGFKLNGEDIKVGQEILYGTSIDLIIGQDNKQASKVIVPDVLGYNRDIANGVIKSSYLNIGTEFFPDVNDLDTNSLIIYKQSPISSSRTSLGNPVQLYYKIPDKDSIQ